MARSSSIVFIAVLASCILLAKAVPVNSNRRGLKYVAKAQDEGHVGKQEPATAAGYGGYRGGQQYEEKRYDSDDDEKQYYGERPSGPDYYHHQEEDYPKVEAKHLCLQESKRTGAVGDIQTSYFRCCAPGDKPDACVDPAETDYDNMRDVMEPDFMNSLVSNPPATCTWKSGLGCPSWTEACFTMELNCTVTASAKECGCPYKSGFMFMAKGYAAKVDAKGCDQTYVAPAAGTGRRLAAANYARANETYYTGDAWIFRGKIHLIATTGGYKEAKGKVEFVTEFQYGVAVNLTRRYDDNDDDNDDDDEYRGRGDRSYDRDDEGKYGRDNYGRDDNRKYGHDDEHNYGRDEEHNYGHDEERNYDERERQYDHGPYEAKAQGYGYGDEYNGGYDRPWLKAGNMQITLYETEYY